MKSKNLKLIIAFAFVCMKKFCFITAFLLVCPFLYGQEMPLNSIAPHRAVFYQEGTGIAIVDGESLTYWLYQSSPDDMKELIGYLHSYVENIGYIVKLDSFSGVYMNPELAESVRSLMSWQKRNVSVTIWYDVLIINIDIEEEGPLEKRNYYFMSWDLING